MNRCTLYRGTHYATHSTHDHDPRHLLLRGYQLYLLVALLHPVRRPAVPLGGGGGVIQGRSSVSQILCEIAVHNLFGVFKDLHGYMLGSAFAHLYHVRGFG